MSENPSEKPSENTADVPATEPNVTVNVPTAPQTPAGGATWIDGEDAQAGADDDENGEDDSGQGKTTKKGTKR